MQPERVAGLDIETINNRVFSFMLNDVSDYTELHKTMQTFMSMSNDRLIMTAKIKGISLGPLVSVTTDHQERVRLLSRLSDHGTLGAEYYVRWPLEVADVILKFIRSNRSTFDFKERFKAKFDIGNFYHDNILCICKRINFERETLNRAEDLLLETFKDKVSGMFVYLRNNYQASVPNYIIFKMIEGFYKSSIRLVPTLGNNRVEFYCRDYQHVPVIPESALSEIIEGLKKEGYSEADIPGYLRITNDIHDEQEDLLDLGNDR